MTDPSISPMSTDELHEVAGNVLHWGKAALARATGIRETTVARWWIGTRPVPLPIAAWLRKLASYHRANPPPEASPFVPAQNESNKP